MTASLVVPAILVLAAIVFAAGWDGPPKRRECRPQTEDERAAAWKRKLAPLVEAEAHAAGLSAEEFQARCEIEWNAARAKLIGGIRLAEFRKRGPMSAQAQAILDADAETANNVRAIRPILTLKRKRS